jgi:hypothetical protein
LTGERALLAARLTAQRLSGRRSADVVVAGTWRMRGGQVALDLWESHPARTTEALEREAAAVEEYLAV